MTSLLSQSSRETQLRSASSLTASPSSNTPRHSAMKSIASITLLAALVSIATINTGCSVALTKSSDVTSLAAPTSTSRIEAPVSVKISFVDSKNEDLRPEIESAIAKALAKAGVATAPSGATVEVVVTEIRRKSKLNDFLWGGYTGSAYLHSIVSLPNGERLNLRGMTPKEYGISTPMNAKGTSEAIGFAAAELAAQIAKRVAAPTLASR